MKNKLDPNLLVILKEIVGRIEALERLTWGRIEIKSGKKKKVYVYRHK